LTTIVSTRPKQLDFDLYAGDSFAVLFEFIDETTGEPWPLEGTFKAEIRSKGEVVTEFTVDDSEQPEGRLRLSLTGDQTQTLAAATPTCHHRTAATTCAQCMSWDLQQDFPGGPRTWYRGAVAVTADVTRPPTP
jgi:hypothetical protein